jgi:hypothetical protein
MVLSWKTTPMLRRSDSSLMLRWSMPSMRIRPDWASHMRCSSDSAVLLPAPVGPTKATVVPAGTFSEKWTSAGRLPS